MATARRRLWRISRSAILDLQTNQIVEYPDARLSDESHQSYFIGLAFSSDGKHLYASVGSLTDPTGAKPGNTGNAIAVYTFAGGKVAPERFIPIAAAALDFRKKARRRPESASAHGDSISRGHRRDSDQGHDKLLIANNLSDNVVVA